MSFFLRFMLVFTGIFMIFHNVFTQSHWETQGSGTIQPLRSIVFYDTSYGIAVGDSGKIIVTSDGGNNWSHRYGQWYVLFNEVTFIDSTTALATGKVRCNDAACGTFYRSTNKGDDWYEVTLTFEINGMTYYPDRGGFAVGYGWDYWTDFSFAGCCRYNESDGSWKSYYVFYQDTTIDETMTDLTYPRSNFCLAITKEGNLYRFLRDTMDNYWGKSYWDLLYSFNHKLNGIYFADTMSGTIVADSGRIWKTTNGGVSWNEQTSGTSQNLNDILYVSQNEGFIPGNNGTLLHTTNGGISWLKEECGTFQHLNKIFFLDPYHGWAVGNNGTIIKRGRFKNFEMGKTSLVFGEIIERETKRDSITVSNTGTDTVNVSSILSDNPEFSADQSSFVLPPCTEILVRVIFSPVTPGSKEGNVIFVHDGPLSPETLHVSGRALDYDTTISLFQPGWHLVSNPRFVANDSIHILFTCLIGDAFYYDGTGGYLESDRLLNGVGYWLKIGEICHDSIEGISVLSDTISVKAGWNLVGSISHPVPVAAVLQNPEGIVVSNYFEFRGSYFPVDTLFPGAGYWVKVNSNGSLTLAAP